MSQFIPKIKQRRVIQGISAGCSKVEMLYRCNFLALVGQGSCPQLPSTKVWTLKSQPQNFYNLKIFPQKILTPKFSLTRRAKIATRASQVIVYSCLRLSRIFSQNLKTL